MKHQDVHGGSMRYYLKKITKNKVSTSVKKYIDHEEKLKLHELEGYLSFKKKN